MSIELVSAGNSSAATKQPPVVKRKGGAWVANGIFVLYTHIIGVGMLALYRPSRWTLMLTIALWICAGVGI